MKTRDMRDKIRNMPLAELVEQEKHLQAELFNLKFQHGTAQLESPMRLKQVKREIARVKTMIGERNREAQKTASGREGL